MLLLMQVCNATFSQWKKNQNKNKSEKLETFNRWHDVFQNLTILKEVDDDSVIKHLPNLS